MDIYIHIYLLNSYHRGEMLDMVMAHYFFLGEYLCIAYVFAFNYDYSSQEVIQ